MNDEESNDATSRPTGSVSRRDFLLTSAAISASAIAGGCVATEKRAGAGAVLGTGRPMDKLRVGLIGCGGRGTGAAKDCLNSAPNVAVVALGDLFRDRLDACQTSLVEMGDKVDVTEDRCFVGFDAYRGVLSVDLDLVILATPPGFRPIHLRAAIEAGKHVFMEKPVAVDPVGVRSVITSSQIADVKGLAIVAGTQRRHDPGYLATMKRIRAGAIGELVAAQCYWNQGGLWVKERQPEWSDMEWQCRNWLYFTWLSGDHIVEQHVHNIDVINWAMGSPPVKAVGLGGRQVRTDPKYGNVFDHFTVEYEYPNGARVLSMCRQIEGSSHRVSERLVGTMGTADPSGTINGRRPFVYQLQGEAINPYVQEHADLVASIRRGRPLNEGRRIAESTMTAIMGRMSAYTGRELSWDWVMNGSKLDLTPPHYSMTELPVNPVAIPGQTKLV